MQMQLQDINWIDYAIMGVIAFSVIMGIVRGFVREAMSLVTWVVAISVGILYCEAFSVYFSKISMLGIRLTLSFVLLVLGSLIIGGIISHVIVRIIRLTGFGITDRIIGTFFGFARGAAIVSILILIVQQTSIRNDKLYQESLIAPKFLPLSHWIKEKIPEDIIKKLNAI